MRNVQVATLEELSALVHENLEIPGHNHEGSCDFVNDPALTQQVLLNYPLEIGPTGHGWYAATPGEGPQEGRDVYVKGASLGWAICAGALALNGIHVEYTGEVPPFKAPAAA